MGWSFCIDLASPCPKDWGATTSAKGTLMIAEADRSIAKPAPSGAAQITPRLLRIALASCAGTTIEFYDFFIYGTAAALVFGRVFFPSLGAAAATAAAFATFGVAFFFRPLGGVLFGHLGDRLGRKTTLISTLAL